jgi:putative transcriptional regulator
MNKTAHSANSTAEAIRRSGRGGLARWTVPSGDDIRSLRKSMSLTQEQFAKTFGFDLQTVRAWEQGIHSPEQVTCLLLGMIKQDHVSVERLIETVRNDDMKITELEPA